MQRSHMMHIHMNRIFQINIYDQCGYVLLQQKLFYTYLKYLYSFTLPSDGLSDGELKQFSTLSSTALCCFSPVLVISVSPNPIYCCTTLTMERWQLHKHFKTSKLSLKMLDFLHPNLTYTPVMS